VDPDDELDCPGCDASVDVRRPIGVEVTILEEPSMTSLPARVTIAVGGVIVHRCDEDELAAEVVARKVGELLRDEQQPG
jgi:hypothetical protein